VYILTTNIRMAHNTGRLTASISLVVILVQLEGLNYDTLGRVKKVLLSVLDVALLSPRRVA
jgi:hypothetical protein